MVLNFEKENLSEILSISLSDRISDRTCDGFKLPDWHALPPEHAIPAKSNLKFNRVFFSFEIGRQIFKIVYEELSFE